MYDQTISWYSLRREELEKELAVVDEEIRVREAEVSAVGKKANSQISSKIYHRDIYIYQEKY